MSHLSDRAASSLILDTNNITNDHSDGLPDEARPVPARRGNTIQLVISTTDGQHRHLCCAVIYRIKSSYTTTFRMPGPFSGRVSPRTLHAQYPAVHSLAMRSDYDVRLRGLKLQPARHGYSALGVSRSHDDTIIRPPLQDLRLAADDRYPIRILLVHSAFTSSVHISIREFWHSEAVHGTRLCTRLARDGTNDKVALIRGSMNDAEIFSVFCLAFFGGE